jgi:F-type H+-transporting ATPase subunit b
LSRSSRVSTFLLVLFSLLIVVSRVVFASPQEAPAPGEHATATEHPAQEERAPAGEHATSQEHAASGEHAGKEESGGNSHEPSPIYRWINFAILVAGLTYILRKPLAQFFSERTDAIRKSLDDGRSALAAAEEKLRAVEQKLQGFEQEMTAFRAAALKEMEDEHARMHRATEQEAERMMESVRVQMDVAGRQARLELRRFAAEQAVTVAEKVVAGRMDDARQTRLVSQFVDKLGAQPGKS